jgi:hypothetical protein
MRYRHMNSDGGCLASWARGEDPGDALPSQASTAGPGAAACNSLARLSADGDQASAAVPWAACRAQSRVTRGE